MAYKPGVITSSGSNKKFAAGQLSGGSKKTTSSLNIDINTLQGLQAFAKQQNVPYEEPEKKLSFLQRLGRGLSALEPANAFFQAKYAGKNFATTYIKDIFTEAGSAITGHEYRKETKKTFKDILVKEGMKDRTGKIDFVDVAGLAGDILTDPSTYFGGSIVKYAGKGVKGIAKVGESVGMKVAPKATTAIKVGVDAATDSLGRAFVASYGSSARARKLGLQFSDEAIKTGDNILPKALEPYIDEAIKHSTPEKFISKVGKEIEYLDPITNLTKKIDTKELFEKYTQTGSLLDETTKYVNKVARTKGGVAEKYVKLFEKLDKPAKEDLANGIYAIRKLTMSTREKLIKNGMPFEEATKKVLEQFDNVMPPNMFKEPANVTFFSEVLLPELRAQKGLLAKKTGMTEDLLMDFFYPAIKKETKRGANNVLRKGTEDYLKRSKGILNFEDIVQDPVEAYAQRAFALEKDGITIDTLNKFVDMYGKPLSTFKNADEAWKSGYKVIKDKGSFGKELGYLAENDHRFLNELFDPSYKIIDNIASATGFDWMTQMFKKWSTGPFASFHIRNIASGIYQNYEVLGGRVLRPDNIADGIRLTKKVLSSTGKYGDEVVETGAKVGDDVTEKAVQTMNLGGREYKVPDLVEAIRERFGISSQYISDFGWEAQEKMIGSKMSKLNPFEYFKIAGNAIETQQKSTAFITALRKGYEIDDALDLAEKAGFDYSKITPFEKHIMRRLIPFYTFSRKNMELQLRTLANNPERLGMLTKFGRAAGTPQGVDTGEITMPDWMRNRFVANIGLNPDGLPEIISGFGTPVEENQELFEKGLLGVLSRLNPLIKGPLEKATGKDFFRERDIKDVYDADEYSEAPDVIKNFLQIQEVEKAVYKDGVDTGKTRTVYVADPDRLHVARNLFTSRGFSYLDDLWGEAEMTETGRYLKLFTGVKAYPVDEQTTEYFEDRNNYRDLSDLMQRLGIVKELKKTYIPKK